MTAEPERDELLDAALTAAMARMPYDRPPTPDDVLAGMKAAFAVYDEDRARHVRERVAEARILGWSMEPGGGMDLRVTMALDVAAHLVTAARTFLDATSAENYVEQHVHDRETGDRYTLTIQRPGKRTPHEMRRLAESERDKLREELERLRAQAVPVGRLRWCGWPECMASYDAATGPGEGGWRRHMDLVLCPAHDALGHGPMLDRDAADNPAASCACGSAPNRWEWHTRGDVYAWWTGHAREASDEIRAAQR